MNTDIEKIPSNLSECFDVLGDILNDSEDKEWFESSSEEDILNSINGKELTWKERISGKIIMKTNENK